LRGFLVTDADVKEMKKDKEPCMWIKGRKRSSNYGWKSL